MLTNTWADLLLWPQISRSLMARGDLSESSIEFDLNLISRPTYLPILVGSGIAIKKQNYKYIISEAGYLSFNQAHQDPSSWWSKPYAPCAFNPSLTNFKFDIILTSAIMQPSSCYAFSLALGVQAFKLFQATGITECSTFTILDAGFRPLFGA